MNKNNGKRVFIVNDVKSSCIDQVIFVLKGENENEVSRDIVEEANEIIYRYARQIEAGQYRNVKQKKGWFFRKSEH